jgi:cation:H+ antiporter
MAKNMFGSLSLPILLLIFAGAAACVWVAGVKLSDTTDVLSSRLGLGQALGGLLLLVNVESPRLIAGSLLTPL